MAVQFTNNAQGTLSAGITNVATSLILNAGQGALFPALSGSDYFYATLADASNNLEIVKCTARAADTLTIVRGQEGTTARAYALNDKVEVRITAAGLANKLDKDTGGTVVGALTITGNFSVTGDTTLGDAGGDTVTFNAGIFTLPGGGIVATGGTVNYATGLQVAGVPVVGTTTAQTLMNKTLTNPIIGTFGNGGNTQTMFTTTDTVVGRNTADTLTNKTITGLNVASTINDSGGTPYRLGFKGLPQSAQNANYTLALADACKHVYSKNAGAQTITIPLNATIAFVVGEDFVTIINNGTTAISISPTGGVTLKWAGSGTTGARTLAVSGWATLLLTEANLWFINGVGLT